MEWPRTRTSDVSRALSPPAFDAPPPPPSAEDPPPIDLVEDRSRAENRFEAALDAITSPSFDRALRTQLRLEQRAQASPERLDGLMRDVLVRGVADPQLETARGSEGFLGERHAYAAASRLEAMPSEEYARFRLLIESTGSPAERALLCKALAAGHSIETIERFALQITGLERAVLVEATSPLDLDDDARDEAHRQRYETSCAPSVAQLLRAESDPIYALALKRGDRGAAEQRRVLEEPHLFAEGPEVGSAVRREDAALVKELASTLQAAERSGLFSERESRALRAHATGARLGSGEQKHLASALKTLRELDDGFPSDAQLAAIRAVRGRIGEGMRAEPALEAIASRSTGLVYQEQRFEHTSLREIETRLRHGLDVVLAVGGADRDEAHFVMVSNVRGAGEEADFLVTDTVSGRTAWVAAADLSNRSFAGEAFALPRYDRVRSWYRERRDR